MSHKQLTEKALLGRIASGEHSRSHQFIARVQRPKTQWAGTQAVTGQVTGQVEALLVAMGEGVWSRKAMMEKLSLKGRDNFEKLYLAPALAAGLIERTIPDKPNSRLQQYRLSEKGRQQRKEQHP